MECGNLLASGSPLKISACLQEEEEGQATVEALADALSQAKEQVLHEQRHSAVLEAELEQVRRMSQVTATGSEILDAMHQDGTGKHFNLPMQCKVHFICVTVQTL